MHSFARGLAVCIGACQSDARNEGRCLMSDEETSELEAYKKKVRAEAIAVADQMNWCSDGLDKSLRKLGLPTTTKKVDLTVELKLKPTSNDTREVFASKTAQRRVRARLREALKNTVPEFVSTTLAVELSDAPVKHVTSTYWLDADAVRHDEVTSEMEEYVATVTFDV